MVGLDNPLHLVFLLLIILLVFGAKRLPEMGRSLGHGLRGFKEAVSGDTKNTLAAGTETEPTPEPMPAAAQSTPEPMPAAARPVVHAESAAAADELEARPVT